MPRDPASGYERLETPEHVDLTVDLAGIGSRALALVVDTVLIVTVLAVVVALAVALAPALDAWALVLVVVAAFLLNSLYFAAFEAGWDGQTPGKRALALRVQRVGGYPIGWTEALLRNLLRVVDAQLAYGVGLLAMLATARSQRLGDLAAGTVVVREREGGAAALERIGYRAEAAPRVARVGVPELATGEYELLHEFLSRRGALDGDAARRIEAALAALLRRRLERRGMLSGAWRSLSDEALLVQLDAVASGQPVAIGPGAAPVDPAGPPEGSTA